jgi:hypothetical protein
VKLHNPPGFADLYVEGADAHQVADQASPVKRPSGLSGYEAGERIGEGEDTDA